MIFSYHLGDAGRSYKELQELDDTGVENTSFIVSSHYKGSTEVAFQDRQDIFKKTLFSAPPPTTQFWGCLHSINFPVNKTSLQ